MNVMKEAHAMVRRMIANGVEGSYKELFRSALQVKHQAYKETIGLLDAPHTKFQLTNTHELQKGDIVRHHGMILRVGEKQISDQGAHADNGYGCAHYHLSEILAARWDMPQPGTRLWNIQGNRLARWEKLK